MARETLQHLFDRANDDPIRIASMNSVGVNHTFPYDNYPQHTIPAGLTVWLVADQDDAEQIDQEIFFNNRFSFLGLDEASAQFGGQVFYEVKFHSPVNGPIGAPSRWNTPEEFFHAVSDDVFEIVQYVSEARGAFVENIPTAEELGRGAAGTVRTIATAGKTLVFGGLAVIALIVFVNFGGLRASKTLLRGGK